MAIKILLVDNIQQDIEWLISSLKVIGYTKDVFVFVDFDQMEKLHPDVILINENLFENFNNQMKSWNGRFNEDTPIILLLQWGKADEDIEQSEAIDVLPKSFISPHLLSSKIRFAIRNARNQSKLKLLAHYDQLTKAANRHLFFDRLHQALLHVKRGNTQYGLILFDLDEFKPVNDKYGHDAGDLLLKTFTNRVKKCIRESDTIGRLGGDEFIALLSNISDKEQLEAIVNKIFRSLRAPIKWQENPITIKASAGLMLLGQTNKKLNSKSVLKKIDAALLRAKSAGKNIFNWAE